MRIDFRQKNPPTLAMVEYAQAIHARVWDHISEVEFREIISSYDKCHAYIGKWCLEYRRLVRRYQNSRPVYMDGCLINLPEYDLI